MLEDENFVLPLDFPCRLFFVSFERLDGDLRALAVFNMDRPAPVPQGLLGLAPRVACLPCALRPRVSVIMQSHAFDLQSLAALLELGRAICRPDGPQIREQGPGSGQGTKDGRAFVAKRDERRLDVGLVKRCEFPAVIANRPVIPIGVLGFEICNIRLGTTQIPAELVKCAALGVALTGDDLVVLFARDCPLLLEFDRGPASWAGWATAASSCRCRNCGGAGGTHSC